MNDKWERIYKEAVVAHVKIPPQHLSARTHALSARHLSHILRQQGGLSARDSTVVGPLRPRAYIVLRDAANLFSIYVWHCTYHVIWLTIQTLANRDIVWL
jgi:hypothetical protein